MLEPYPRQFLILLLNVVQIGYNSGLPHNHFRGLTSSDYESTNSTAAMLLDMTSHRGLRSLTERTPK